jgi:hypothetical protein
MEKYNDNKASLFFNKLDIKWGAEFPIFLDKNEFYLNYKSYNNFFNEHYRINPLLIKDFNYNRPVIEDESTNNNFYYIRKSTIKSFFNSHMVDIPLCFKKSRSLYSKNFELPLIKLSNMIMRDGLRLKILNVLGTTFFSFINTFQKTLINPDIYNWLSINITLNNLTINPLGEFDNNLISDELPLNTSYNNKFSKSGVSFHIQSSFNSILFESIKEYLPIFSFFVRKVDKSVRKNSRGKSGKYVIIWKYVPSYKRLYITLRWFIKDLKFQKSNTFKSRFLKILETFILNPKLSFLVKLRQFVHVYVFENLKNKLMKNLRTTS